MSKRAMLGAAAISALALAGVLMGVLTFGPVLAMLYDSTAQSQAQIQSNLVRAATQAGAGGTVRLVDVEATTWDTVYVWDGRTASTRGPQVFGAAAKFGDGSSNQAFVVAFADHGKLVAWVRFDTAQPMVWFDLGTSGSLQASRSAATFNVEQATDSTDAAPRFVLHLAGS